MDSLPALGRGVFEVLGPTFAAYEPLLRAREAAIRSTRRETHQYGPEPRQALDVYYPDADAETVEAVAAETAAATASSSGLSSNGSSNKKATRKAKPILVFLYGGGFVQGDKQTPGLANGLVFANLAHYFASRHGFTVVVPDYRLLAHGAKFPSGGADCQHALDWVAGSLTQQPAYRDVPLDLFLLGNSVGAVHATTWALHPAFAPSVADFTSEAGASTSNNSHHGGVRLRGLLLLGAPAHFGGDDNEILRGYFGAEPDAITRNAPLGLLAAAKQRVKGEGAEEATLLPGVRVALLISELDPEYIFASGKDFAEAWPDPSRIETLILKGHNHISPQVSLGTGVEREEAWGEQVVGFCRAAAGT